MHPHLMLNKETLCPLVSAIILSTSVLFIISRFAECHIFHSFCLFFGDFIILNSPKCSTEVLSRAPKHKKAAMDLMEKMHLLDKLCSSMCHRAVGCRVKVNDQ